MTNEFLSKEGQHRRDQILLLAKAEAKRRRNRRWAGRSIGVVGALSVAALICFHAPTKHFTPAARPMIVRGMPAPAPLPTPPPLSTITVQYIQTDPTIADRLTLPAQPARWTSINDDQLLQELAAAGQPAGIVYMDGKTYLLPRGGMR